MTLPAPRTTIISVCYNSTAVLPAMLSSVPAGVAVVLVDNASTDSAALAPLAESHAARLIRSPENRGFGVGCNLGAAEAKTEFLLFLNPDAQLLDGAIAALEAAMDRYPKASAMNPRITEADGSAYFKRRSVLLPRKDHMPRGWPDADCEVPVLSGAAMFIRRRDFEAVGGFDPKIFLYHEDDDLSLRLKAERGPLMFIRDAAVRHIGGSSTARSPESAAFKAWHMGRSRVYAGRKHGQPTGLVSAALELLSPATLFSARYRAKKWAFFRGMINALRDEAPS